MGYDGSPDPHPTSLFAFEGSNFNFEGSLSEFLVYDGILSATDLDAVEAYLSARSGEPPVIDLTNGEVVQYESGCQPDAQWIADLNGRTIDQLINSDASIYVTEQESYGDTITGRLGAGNAPDFMGFVFGFQDRHRYYLFDWKRVAASFCGGSASAGMRLRVVDYPISVDPTGAEMWDDSSTHITLLASNDVPWAPYTDYDFELVFDAGMIHIQIRDGATILESWSIADSTFTSGEFGLFTNSLQNVAFGPFISVPEPGFASLLGSGVLALAFRGRRRTPKCPRKEPWGPTRRNA